MNKKLTNFNKKDLAVSEKNRTFANDIDDEPTALATDVGKPIPILSGEVAIRFIENAKKAEREAERRRNEFPTLEELKKQLVVQKFFLDDEKRKIEERIEKIKELEKKIKFLETN